MKTAYSRRMLRRAALPVALTALSVATLAPAVSAASFTPGAPGVGDSYFPLEGNGGYDAGHYSVNLSYTPKTNRLSGKVTLPARATQNLSSFDLDLKGLTVTSVKVNGRKATFSR